MLTQVRCRQPTIRDVKPADGERQHVTVVGAQAEPFDLRRIGTVGRDDDADSGAGGRRRWRC